MTDHTSRVMALDTNAPWIRAIFQAMPADVHVDAIEVQEPRAFLRKERAGAVRALGWNSIQPSYRTRTIPVPGLRRFRRLSARVVRRALGQPRPDVLALTNPWHVHAFERLEAGLKVYYPSDAFEYYEWPHAATHAREQVALDTADLVLAMSVQQSEDFRERTRTEVIHFPNAVEREFVSALASNPTPASDVDRAGYDAIVGCVGRINDTYDWAFIDGLVEALPNVRFVFVGPVTGANVVDPERIRRSLDQPNVLWLGERDHALVPSYLASFDICLNPLAQNDHNDRRCPLRLYDYMATHRPILSTAIREASEFGDGVQVAAGVAEGCEMIRAVLRGGLQPETASRENWLRDNTWHARAREFAALMNERTP